MLEHVVLTLGRALAPEQQRVCLTSGLARALGLPGTSKLLTPSVFSLGEEARELSATARLVIRALYDPPLRPGMSRKAAMSEVRDVFTNLLRK